MFKNDWNELRIDENDLRENEVNVEYMYAFANPQCKNAIMIFRFDDLEKASQVLAANNIKVINLFYPTII